MVKLIEAVRKLAAGGHRVLLARQHQKGYSYQTYADIEAAWRHACRFSDGARSLYGVNLSAWGKESQ